MLKSTSKSAVSIELSIHLLSLVYLSNVLYEHISLLKEEFPCKIHEFRLYHAQLMCIYIFRVYMYTMFFSAHQHSVYYMGAGQENAGLFV